MVFKLAPCETEHRLKASVTKEKHTIEDIVIAAPARPGHIQHLQRVFGGGEICPPLHKPAIRVF